MCGIAGIYNTANEPIDNLSRRIEVMKDRQRHRGPDGEGTWLSESGHVGLGHVRLSIIDLSSAGAQPMRDEQAGLVISYNGEIYNFKELRSQLEQYYTFRTQSDTEVILKAYLRWGTDCPNHLRGMFAFVIWDERKQSLFAARDRFGIKPLYAGWIGKTVYLASEIKAILPFMPEVKLNRDALQDYLTFQFCLKGKTLFENIEEVPPATSLVIDPSGVKRSVYWKLNYEVDWDHTEKWFESRCSELVYDSIRAHLVSDVPVSSHISGGIDSSAAAILAKRMNNDSSFMGFHGRFDCGDRYDESAYARAVAEQEGIDLHEIMIGSDDFIDSFEKLIYSLDFPVAGPGSFAQFMVAKYIKKHSKVVLGGQGADEIFGGYVRYLIAYFEQCFKGAINGQIDSPKFLVTYASIIPHLGELKGYEPLMQHFFSKGLFEDYDKRYFQLVNRSGDLSNEINWHNFSDYKVYDEFRDVYFSNQIGKNCYFDSMLHFDFITLLPALLQVEDRTSMAHGIESRTPFLDHPLVEFVATIPANVKFQAGELKRLPKRIFKNVLPPSIINRTDKMGFPVPLVKWYANELKPFISEAFAEPSEAASEYLNYDVIRDCIANENLFSRKVWGFLCLDRFCKLFIDGHRQAKFEPETTLIETGA